MVKNLPAMQETQVQSPGEENGNPLQYSFLEDPMDRGAWLATVQVTRVRHDLATKPPSSPPPPPPPVEKTQGKWPHGVKLQFHYGNSKN